VVDLTGRSILITGGSGFIGRRAVAAMRAAGADVTVADLNPFPGHPDVPVVQGDLLDPSVRAKAITAGTDAIVHLAAFTSVLRSIEQPAEVVRTNVEMTAGLLDLAREHGVGCFVLASTNAVVGDVGARTITEELPLWPLTPYGATKAAGEMLLAGLGDPYGIRGCALRFSNVYGPGMAHKDSFVPRLMRAAASGGGVQVYGDGTQIRDLVHVDDVAQAIGLAVAGWPAGRHIIGAGSSVSVNDLVDAAREATGAALPVEHVPAKPGEMPAVVVDISKARSQGYDPQVGLVDGFASVWPEFNGSATASATGAAAEPSGQPR